MSQEARAAAARRRALMSRRRVHAARNTPKEVTAPDTEEFPTIPFPECNSKDVFKADVYENQGTRQYMEDFNHVVIADDHSFFGVFDGHGGRSVPSYVKEHLYDHIQECLKDERFKTPEEAIKESFLILEKNLYVKSRKRFTQRQEESGEGENEEKDGTKNEAEKEVKKTDESTEEEERISGGSCCSILYISDDQTCISANLGDSKMVLYSRNGEFKVLTVDHDTNNPDEVKRITEDLEVHCKAGGRIGGLKITRSFGDFFRPKGKKVICAEPYITKFTIDPKVHHSVVIASDGLWENTTEQEVFEEIRNEVDPRISTRKLMTKVVEKVRDNITICVLHFHEKISEETKRRAEMLKKFMASRYANDGLIKKALEYRRQREENPDSPSAYKRMLEAKKRENEENESDDESDDDDDDDSSDTTSSDSSDGSSSSDDDDDDDDSDEDDEELVKRKNKGKEEKEEAGEVEKECEKEEDVVEGDD